MAFDLDAVIAEEEANARPPYEFTFDGETYVLPPVMDVRAIAAISGGRLDDGLRMLMNPAQWTKLQDAKKVLTQNALEALFNDYAKYSGAEGMGESAASTPSLVSTATP